MILGGAAWRVGICISHFAICVRGLRDGDAYIVGRMGRPVRRSRRGCVRFVSRWRDDHDQTMGDGDDEDDDVMMAAVADKMGTRSL